MAADELRLRVSASDYAQRISTLDSKMNNLQTILQEYEELKRAAGELVLGRDDSNFDQLQAAVEQNIKAVQGQFNLLKESREMLQKQTDQLGITSQKAGKDLTDTMEAAKSALGVIKAIKDIVG